MIVLIMSAFQSLSSQSLRGSYSQTFTLTFRSQKNNLNYQNCLRFSSLPDSALQTKSQLLSISGNPPLLIESQKCWQSSINIAGEQGLPLKVLLLT